MKRALVWSGYFLIVYGVFLSLSALSAARMGDEFLYLLGTPIVISGVWVCACGVLFLALARIIEILESKKS